MKKVFSFLFIVLMIFCFSPSVFAQGRGDIALGLRFTPDGGGFTGKFFLDQNFAIEAQLNAGGLFDGTSVSAVGLIEYNIVLPQPEWRIFFGGGIHFGVWDRYDDNSNQGIFGIDGIGGVSYTFKKVPIELSADFKPAINFVSDVAFFPHNIIGVAGRFYIPHAKRK
ncbi:MAG TPA: hypothetical protein VN721_11675 [Flavipsychrobacter sp.]|nr:hypothetical protein [Flavipsychrobacter sp.]